LKVAPTSTKLPAQSGRHIPALDGVRGIAIFATVGIHAIYARAIPEPPPRYLSLFHVMVFGWMGVDLFFVLSGFLITGILLDTKLSDNYFGSFYARRTLRIFPLYYGVLLVLLCLSPLIAQTRMSVVLPVAGAWPAYFAYLQNWWIPLHPVSSAGAIGLFWSLGVEEQFYLLWPLVVFLLPKRAFVGVCVAVCLLVPVFRLDLVIHDPHSNVAFMNTFARMDTLVWGALAAVVVRAPAALQRVRLLLPYVLAVCATVVLVIDFPLHELYERSFFTQSIGFTAIAIGSASFLLLAYFANPRGRLAGVLTHPVLRSLGRYSYGMYVLHFFLIAAVEAYLGPLPLYGHSVMFGVMVFTGIIVMSWGIAWVSYHLYEQPFLKLKSRFKAELRSPHPSSSE